MLGRIVDWVTRDWALKLTALALAFLMWVTVRADSPGEATWNLPVQVVSNDPGWVVAGPPEPAAVTASLRGPYAELLRAASPQPTIVIPVQEVTDSSEVYVVQRSWVRTRPGSENLQIGPFNPPTVRVRYDRVQTRLIPVAAPQRGELPVGYELAGPIEVDPGVVRASGAARSLARIDSLRVPPIDLRDRRSWDTLEVAIDTLGTGLVVSPRTVRVFVPIRPITDTVTPLAPTLRPIR